MDLKLIKDVALEETARFFREHGYLPDQDSEEWEAAYRHQFELAKKRYAGSTSAARNPAAADERVEGRDDEWPALTGAPAETRWAHALRAERLKQIEPPDLRRWLAGAWTASKAWIDTRELPAAQFLSRAAALYTQDRRRSEARAGTLADEQKAKADAEASVRRQVQAAGITAEGLIGLVDVSARTAPAPLKDKLAEVNATGRSLRIFESANPAVLMVLEKTESGRVEYAIEHDAGLVADLKLFAQSES